MFETRRTDLWEAFHLRTTTECLPYSTRVLSAGKIHSGEFTRVDVATSTGKVLAQIPYSSKCFQWRRELSVSIKTEHNICLARASETWDDHAFLVQPTTCKLQSMKQRNAKIIATVHSGVGASFSPIENIWCQGKNCQSISTSQQQQQRQPMHFLFLQLLGSFSPACIQKKTS